MTDVRSHTRTAPAELAIRERVAILTLNRPESYNSIDLSMAKCLARCAAEVEASEGVRVLVIRGAGKAFCSGGDIGFFASNLDTPEPPIRALLGSAHEFLATLRRMGKIVLTSVHGVAAGAGFSLAFMGDLCVAAEDARFRPAYAALGVSPDCGGTIGVVDSIGVRGALQVFLGEVELTSQRAAALGLVARTMPTASLERATLEFAEHLANINYEAVKATKSLLYASPRTSLREQLNREMESLIACMQTAHFKENVRRFYADRPISTRTPERGVPSPDSGSDVRDQHES